MINTSMKKPSPSKKAPVKAAPIPMQKMTTVKSAEKCSTCSCTTTPKKSEPKSTSKKTVVRVMFDCGFPNTLFIRGEGCASLSWTKGLPMKNISNNEWLWECARPCSQISFKVLINDEVYEVGENHTISYGDELTIQPNF